MSTRNDSRRVLTNTQIEQVYAVTDQLDLNRDAVVIPLVADREGTGLVSVLPDGKLLVRPPPGAAFDAWHGAFRDRLLAMDLSKVPHKPTRR